MQRHKLSTEKLDSFMNWINDVVSKGCENSSKGRGLTNKDEYEIYRTGFHDSARFICGLICQAQGSLPEGQYEFQETDNSYFHPTKTINADAVKI